jgi:hypothetical protein
MVVSFIVVYTVDPSAKPDVTRRRRAGAGFVRSNGRYSQTMTTSLGDLADVVRSALTAGDLEAYQHLLAPDAHWGPPDDPGWGCHSRHEILAWYKAAQAEGMRAVVTEIIPGADCLLVGLKVSGPAAAQEAGESAPRWQVLTVRDGLIVDICGFDDRAEAADRAGIPA